MNAVARRKIEMGWRALELSRAHPDTEPGYRLAEAKLGDLCDRSAVLAGVQREGLLGSRAAAARTAALRRAMQQGPIAHLFEVGRSAAGEEHGLALAFLSRSESESLLAFRTMAGSMLTAARAHRAVMVAHGLAESLVAELASQLEELDAAMHLGMTSRSAHVGATTDLQRVATAIARTVRIMDGRNRQRFRDAPELLGSWINASTVLGTPKRSSRGAAEPRERQPLSVAPGGERPAA